MHRHRERHQVGEVARIRLEPKQPLTRLGFNPLINVGIKERNVITRGVHPACKRTRSVRKV